MSGYFLLEDGARFDGEFLRGENSGFGEAVFNTSHSGYQEILTDPSYYQQIMVFTAPHIGNVGINRDDVESPHVQVAGALIRNLAPQPRNFRAERDLISWLEEARIPVLVGANTRGITLYLRRFGAMRSGIFSAETPLDEALDLVKRTPGMVGADLATKITCKTKYSFDSHLAPAWQKLTDSGRGLRVAVFDFGVKLNILRELVCRGCEVIVLPAQTGAGEVMKGNYNGVLLSNGPGDPAPITYAIDTVRELIGKIPIFGICLGHQILSLAAGLQTFKLPFGHRGANHPVRREVDSVVEITCQNHGFAVVADSISSAWRFTHMNLNDNTVEGLEHTSLPIFSIQYHPEASPGPHDAITYFDRFITEMHNAQAR